MRDVLVVGLDVEITEFPDDRVDMFLNYTDVVCIIFNDITLPYRHSPQPP